MMPPHIRPYSDADEQGVVDLWRAVFADDPPHNEPRAVIRRKLAVQPELFLVLVADGDVLGTVLAGFDGVRGWVHHVAVHPEHRRRGYGTLLMREAEARLRGLGAPKVNLQVRAGNEEVVAFYRSLGYAVEKRVSMGRLLLDGEEVRRQS